MKSSFQEVSAGELADPNAKKVAGIDGCKNGWMMVRPDGNSYRWKARRSFEQLMEEESDLELVLVDMPIGLSERKKGKGEVFHRTVEMEMKEVFHGNKSSIFTPPSREAVEIPHVADAQRKNNEVLGKGIQLSALGIRNKIGELDQFVRNKKKDEKPWVAESHPELCFERVKKDKGCLSHKKSTEEGLEERIEILKNYSEGNFSGNLNHATKGIPGDLELGPTVFPDDLIDALCLCVVAEKGADKGFQALRNEPINDLKDIRIELLFPKEDSSG